MFSLFAAAVLAQAGAKTMTWYGPVTATFEVEFAGDPYDPAQNDVRVQFVGEKGQRFERLAYYDGEGDYRATLVADQPGKYQATLIRNGVASKEEAKEGVLDARQPLKRGFIRVDPLYKNRFRWDNGDAYYPIGFDFGWQGGPNMPSLKDQIKKMGANGVNWTRIWASSWDGKNPWWPQDDKDALLTTLWSPALTKWQEVVDACDSNGVPFQMVLFNHGLFSSRVNPNWPDHPWNAAKGGFLKDAADFFTDPEAKRRTKMWLRYAVARFASSPDLLAWELFNEVEWVDARYADRWNDISAWHQEMADYLRSIDPYHHLVTTSSTLEPPSLWTAMDYYQPHTYPPDVASAIGGAKLPTDKPAFFGEFGPGGPVAKNAPVVRDGIYAGVLANQAGAGMYWYWDIVEKENLYPEFKVARKIIDGSEVAKHPYARPASIRVHTEGRSTLSFGPGLGWAKSTTTEISLPEGVTPAALGGLSGYLQAPSKPDMQVPVMFHLDAPAEGTLTMRVSQVQKSGATVVATVNGKEALRHAFPATEKDTEGPFELKVPYPKGRSEIRIENVGADWAIVDRFSFSGLAPQARVQALGETDWLAMRIQAADGAPAPFKADLASLPLVDGSYSASVYDIATGESVATTLIVKNGAIVGFPVDKPDLFVVVRK